MLAIAEALIISTNSLPYGRSAVIKACGKNDPPKDGEELWVNLGDDGLRGGVSRRVTSLPEPPERSDTPCREIPTFSGSVSLTQSTIP